MEATEIRAMAALEDTHWWYRERRHLLARMLSKLPRDPNRAQRALDVGAAAGGNTRVLREHGWHPLALEHGAAGAELAASRGLPVIRADARALPIATDSMDVVVAFDVLEHIDQDYLAAAELRRVVRPDGNVLIAVPCDVKLWSGHDEAVHHFRRYSRTTLRRLVEQAGLVIDKLWSWNVLMRPIAARHKRKTAGADLVEPAPFLNKSLMSIIAIERYLPVGWLPGVSLMVRAHPR